VFGITDVPKDFAQATEHEDTSKTFSSLITLEHLERLLWQEDDSHKIGELPSTAICGNDITASCTALSFQKSADSRY